MSLYANYMPEPEQQDLTLSQAARIESRQENLQAQYESEVQQDHFRFYGQFKNGHEFDVMDFSEILLEVAENNDDSDHLLDSVLPIYEWIKSIPEFLDNFHNCSDIDNPTPTQIHHVIFDDDISDNDYQNLLSLIDDTFNDQVNNHNFSIHEFDDSFNFIYDLKDNDDLHDLADQYYES